MTELDPIGFVKNDFKDKFSIPRQSGMVPVLSEIVFLKSIPPEAFSGITDFDYIWLIWGFDKTPEPTKYTVRPPRLGGNTRVGVFATRSPFRPNRLGLSSVKLVSVSCVNSQTILTVSGADLKDGTPIYDVKPYLPYTDCHENARFSFAKPALEHKLEVVIPNEIAELIPKKTLTDITSVLSLDPRPSYQTDDRTYAFFFSDYEIKFKVLNNALTVTEITVK